MLVKASWFDEIRTELGMQGVSQLWAQRPAWYFWIADAPGVYLLELAAADSRQMEGFDLHRVTFALKCYPFAGQQVFKFFSFEEQGLIRSPYFDHTNTPRFDQREKIDPHLFNIAKIECTFDGGETMAAFVFESLDTWRIVFNKGTTLNYPMLDRRKKFASGEVDRQVPGIQIGFLFFDRLLSLFAFDSQTTPARVLSLRSRGFEYVYDKSDRFVCVDSENARIYTTAVLFALSDPPAALERMRYIENELKAEYEETLYDRQFSGDHSGAADNPMPRLMPLNQRWWSLAKGHFNCSLTSSCGCS